MNTHLLNNIIIIICLRTGVSAGASPNEPLYTVIGPIYPRLPGPIVGRGLRWLCRY